MAKIEIGAAIKITAEIPETTLGGVPSIKDVQDLAHGALAHSLPLIPDSAYKSAVKVSGGVWEVQVEAHVNINPMGEVHMDTPLGAPPVSDCIPPNKEKSSKGPAPCPFCGHNPWFEGDGNNWRERRVAVEMSIGCCARMSSRLEWKTAKDMTPQARRAKLEEHLTLMWNVRSEPEEK